ncbi:TetR/AcrR family transcriptional regulator [Luteipulveratus flavus]|uniref:TetR/AcrR family transcriptional regulator n=1 Tax=Luteipulveratus flavus TaxID=3031728 RepID=A0ABT6C4T3_9MICO|nr:TetR/AcrR family transcriptional regulator [Luteipulveratus sp. YIM 133296]MDF8263307.1 TetR/AcrR family transcriptional regulator [Luteipulveratus sp. YIM 133296]
MSTAPARPRPTTDRRQRILDAAGPVFGEHGYERASVDAIARAAQVSKPTIYSHFGSKEQLFQVWVGAVARQVSDDAVRAVHGLDVSPKKWRAALVTAATDLVEAWHTDCAASLARTINAEVGRDPQIYAVVREAAHDPVIEALAGRLAMLGNAGLLRVPDPVLAAKQLIALSRAELDDISEFGTKPTSAPVVRRVVKAGVETFLRAYEA